MFFLLLPPVSPKLVLSRVGNHSEKQYLDPFQDHSEWCLVDCKEGRTAISPCPSRNPSFPTLCCCRSVLSWQGEYCHSNTITNCNETPNFTFIYSHSFCSTLTEPTVYKVVLMRACSTQTCMLVLLLQATGSCGRSVCRQPTAHGCD